MTTKKTTKEVSLELVYEFGIRRFSFQYEMYSNLTYKILELFKLFASFTPMLLGMGYYLLSTRFTWMSFVLLIESTMLYLITIGYCLTTTLSQGTSLVTPLEAYTKCHEREPMLVLDALAKAVCNDWENIAETRRKLQSSLRIMNLLIFATLFQMFVSYSSLFFFR